VKNLNSGVHFMDTGSTPGGDSELWRSLRKNTRGRFEMVVGFFFLFFFVVSPWRGKATDQNRHDSGARRAFKKTGRSCIVIGHGGDMCPDDLTRGSLSLPFREGKMRLTTWGMSLRTSSIRGQFRSAFGTTDFPRDKPRGFPHLIVKTWGAGIRSKSIFFVSSHS